MRKVIRLQTWRKLGKSAQSDLAAAIEGFVAEVSTRTKIKIGFDPGATVRHLSHSLHIKSHSIGIVLG